jgi:hypothetical protein
MHMIETAARSRSAGRIAAGALAGAVACALAAAPLSAQDVRLVEQPPVVLSLDMKSYETVYVSSREERLLRVVMQHGAPEGDGGAERKLARVRTFLTPAGCAPVFHVTTQSGVAHHGTEFVPGGVRVTVSADPTPPGAKANWIGVAVRCSPAEQ